MFVQVRLQVVLKPVRVDARLKRLDRALFRPSPPAPAPTLLVGGAGL